MKIDKSLKIILLLLGLIILTTGNSRKLKTSSSSKTKERNGESVLRELEGNLKQEVDDMVNDVANVTFKLGDQGKSTASNSLVFLTYKGKKYVYKALVKLPGDNSREKEFCFEYACNFLAQYLNVNVPKIVVLNQAMITALVGQQNAAEANAAKHMKPFNQLVGAFIMKAVDGENMETLLSTSKFVGGVKTPLTAAEQATNLGYLNSSKNNYEQLGYIGVFDLMIMNHDRTLAVDDVTSNPGNIMLDKKGNFFAIDNNSFFENYVENDAVKSDYKEKVKRLIKLDAGTYLIAVTRKIKGTYPEFGKAGSTFLKSKDENHVMMARINSGATIMKCSISKLDDNILSNLKESIIGVVGKPFKDHLNVLFKRIKEVVKVFRETN